MECSVTTPTNAASVVAAPETIAATNVQPVVADPETTATTAFVPCIILTATAPSISSTARTPETSTTIVGNTLFGYRSLFLHQHLASLSNNQPPSLFPLSSRAIASAAMTTTMILLVVMT